MTLPSEIVLLIRQFAGSSINDKVIKDPLWRAYMAHCDRVVGLPGPLPSLFIYCKMRRKLKDAYKSPPRSYWQCERRRGEMAVRVAMRDGLPIPPTRHPDWVNAGYIAARNPTP
jgi:hypothetical protein